MDALVPESHDDRRTHFENEAALMDKLTHGQQPKIMYVGCSDSRVMPSRIFGAVPGDVFVMRNIANIIPPADAQDRAVGAVVEYAVNHLQVEHIVVCGHSQCGGIQSLGFPYDDAEPALSCWLDYARPVHHNVAPDLKGVARLNAMIEANVLLQVQNLRTHLCVQKAEAAGKLQVHAWVYDFKSGLVRAYDEVMRGFIEEPPFNA